MRAAARRIARLLGFFLSRVSRRLDSFGRTVAVASLTKGELDSLGVIEWEEFGTGGPVIGPETFAWEREFFGSQIRSGDSVLVVGAGSGRDALPLLTAGHRVTALDITPRALEILRDRAARSGFEVPLIVGSIAEATLPPAAFDVVLFSWFSFSYLRTAADRRAALERSVASLKPGGRILLSFPPADANITAAQAPRGGMLANVLGGTTTEKGDHYSVSGSASRPNVFYAHFFAEGDVEREAAECGLVPAFTARPTYGVFLMTLVRREPRP